VLTVGDGTAEVAITLRRDFFHAAHAAHGAVYFKALDDAAFFAAQSEVTDVFVLTVNFSVTLLRPLKEGVITATGRVIHKSRNLITAESHLKDARGRLAASGHGTFMRSDVALDAKIGYV
jgi:uncharacterized protein (TIGR00369 family)